MNKFAIVALLATTSFAGLSRKVGNQRNLKRTSGGSRSGGDDSTYSSRSYDSSHNEGDDKYCREPADAGYTDYDYGEFVWTLEECPMSYDYYYEMATQCTEDMGRNV